MWKNVRFEFGAFVKPGIKWIICIPFLIFFGLVQKTIILSQKYLKILRESKKNGDKLGIITE
jgi:hypothetical protein